MSKTKKLDVGAATKSNAKHNRGTYAALASTNSCGMDVKT